MKRRTVQTFLVCPECSRVAVIHRRYERQKEVGHIKDLWCHQCKAITKHVEYKTDYAAERAAKKMRRMLAMMTFLGVKIIDAEPQEKDGKAGYKVVYEDGYISWSPKSTFEKAYRPTNGLNFGLAIEALKQGKCVARKGWNGKGIFIELQTPDEHSKITSPYIFIDTTGLHTDNQHAPKSRVPWLASQTDMLADDWIIVE